MRYVVRPLSDRTAFSGRHRASPFSAKWSTTEALLLREVQHLRGDQLVVEADVTESMIRIDGGLYASARPATPAVRVAFESKYGPLVYATDRFSHWQDNVRAIALGLEALRRVDRYGITQKGQQYTGWKALEGGPDAPMTEREAELIFGKWSGEAVWLTEDTPSIWRRARANAHPDRNGGDRTAWDQVEEAARVLGVAS